MTPCSAQLAYACLHHLLYPLGLSLTHPKLLVGFSHETTSHAISNGRDFAEEVLVLSISLSMCGAHLSSSTASTSQVRTSPGSRRQGSRSVFKLVWILVNDCVVAVSRRLNTSQVWLGKLLVSSWERKPTPSVCHSSVPDFAQIPRVCQDRSEEGLSQAFCCCR